MSTQRTGFTSSKIPHMKKVDFLYWPCIKSDVSCGLRSLEFCDTDDSDDDEVPIEYIRFSSHNSMKHDLKQPASEVKLVSKRRLVPYYGTSSKGKSVDTTRWCSDLCTLYMEQRRIDLISTKQLPLSSKSSSKTQSSTSTGNGNASQVENVIQAELLFLQNILSDVQHKQNNKILQQGRVYPIKNHVRALKNVSDEVENENKTNANQNRNVVSRNATTSTSDSDTSDSDDSSFEEPYTQALGKLIPTKRLLLDDSEDSEEEREKNRQFFFPNLADRKQQELNGPKKKEPIRVGDVISYYSRIFRWGDERGKRIATVLSVDPNRSPILVLDNGEILPEDTKVQRIKVPFHRTVKTVLEKGKIRKIKETVLVDHPGMFRCIEDFKLKVRNGHIGVQAGIQAEARRLNGIIQKYSSVIEEKTQELFRNSSCLLNKSECGNQSINIKSKEVDRRNKNFRILSSDSESSSSAAHSEDDKISTKKCDDSFDESNFSSPSQPPSTTMKKKSTSIDRNVKLSSFSSSSSSSSPEKSKTVSVSQPCHDPVQVTGAFRLKRYAGSTPKAYPIDFERS
jgi:hypothetical protein